ncbi:DUF4861 domain-containing protein [Flammeovirgaceae bacterium SG7u.111]|nr:DUF4861 domain-containing protein [Flammeovirgaceae bacterium SG7u.132]WPO33853.1 DUF4861 domain-containing protein [Flammeovirgaceae bacterium SG7u.111]
MRFLIQTLLLMAFGLGACQKGSDIILVEVQNPSKYERNEVVSVKAEALQKLLNGNSESGLVVKEKGGKDPLVIQWIDFDGESDELLFQASLAGNESKTYEISWEENVERPEPKLTTYSRFVPERTDDYTWENDKVAFRTYGPVAQQMIEEKVPGGTLSSGIDLWLKRVDYSIIDDWYAKNTKEVGYYHIDHGEGYDPYHVGKSRGTGGIGIWENDTLLTSKNFTAYRRIASGPLRTVFELDYAPWSEFGVKETKRISLDLGSNFSKFEISLSSEQPVPNYTIGITLHKQEGEVSINEGEGVFSHWEEIDSAFVGEGIVIDPTVVKKGFDFRTDTPDQSQLLVVTDSAQQKLTYYAGFVWTKSGQASNQSEWLEILKKQADLVANPVVVQVN